MASSSEPGQPPFPVVFFDGTCGFCDRSVTFLFARDPRHRLRFAPLQGAAAAAMLDERRRTDLDTMVLVVGGKTLDRSTAALTALKLVGGGWGALGALGLLVPRGLRDLVYGVIAKNRYRIFGKSEACRLPTKEERAYFLD